MPLDNQSPSLWIQPTGGPLAADVHGIDLSRPIDETTAGKLADAWAKHLVLRFSGQRLNDDDLMRFSRVWGELDLAPLGTGVEKVSGVAANATKWVIVISNVKVGGKPIGGLGSYESVWHTDMSYNPLPPRASLLYSIECPSSGGDTGFSNMEMAYDTLSDDLKKTKLMESCVLTTQAATRQANIAGVTRKQTIPAKRPARHIRSFESIQ